MEDQIILRNSAGLVEIRREGYYYNTWKIDGNGLKWNHLILIPLEFAV